MTVAVILRAKGGDVVAIESGRTVREAIALLAERRIGAVLVLAHGEVAGIFSERDVIRLLAEAGPSVLDRPVESAMSTPAVTSSPDQPVLAALSLMTQRRIRHLPVVEEGRVVGIVSIGDLVKHRIDRIEAEAAAMRDYIQR